MGIGGRISSSKRRDKIISLANNAVQRYHLHPNYRILHDAISDFFAHCLDMDISNLNNYHNHESSKCLEITSTADACPYIDSSYDRATLLCESIAKKLFPRKSGEEEVDYACRVRKKLRNKVLVPLRKVRDKHYSRGSNRWGYTSEFKKEPSKAQSYLEELKAGKCQIKADALLPSEIFACLTRRNNVDGAMDDVVELQWKAMVDMYLKQGKFKNCLAAFDVTPYEEITVGLGILVSQLNEEASWKGKAITFSENPKLVSIQGDDLKSKYEFMSDVEDAYYREIDLEKVFDLILGVGVNENLKPEQMIKKMFVFTRWGDCNSNKNRLTSSDYEAIECRFKEKGYVVPQILFWEVYDHKSRRAAGPAGWTQPGMKLFSGTGDNLVKLFLENDGDIVPHHVMEAALAGQEYQSLLLVD